MKKNWAWIVVASSAALLFAACATWMGDTPAERLFFALQIEDGERVVARPQLLGEAGKRLTLRLAQPARPEEARLSLELSPERFGEGYRVRFGIGLPDRADVKRGELSLLHGEERKLVLTDSVRPLTVRLMVMRVASPEFEAWIRLARTPPATS